MNKQFIIHSPSEHGFWNNKDGWVYNVVSATQFMEKEIKEVNLPYTPANDCEWVISGYDE